MKIPDTMISDAIKKSARYNYYIDKKKEIANDKIVDEPEEQRVSPVKSGRGKGFMCYGDQVVNVPNKLKKDVMPRKIRSLTITEETVVGELANSINTYDEWGQKLKGPAVDDPSVQSLLDLQKRSKASRLESLKQKKQSVIGEGSSNAHNKHYVDLDTDSDALLYSLCSEESDNETDDADDSDMDLSHDNPDRDDDAAGFGNVSERECSSYTISTSKENYVYYNDSPTNLTLSQSNEVDAKGKKEYEEDQLQEGNHTKFREYDQKLEALTNFNESEVFEKAVQARILTEIKKLLPIYILKAVANYDRPRLNTSVLDVMKNNQISLFTKPSTSIDDLSDIDLKLKLLHRIYESKLNTTHPTNQKHYDTLYESACLDHDALNAQDAEPSFHKRSRDNQDPPNNHEGENKKKRRKDVSEPSSRSLRRNKSPVVHAQVDTPAIQPLDQEDEYVRNHPNLEWFPKKSGSWFDLLLKSDIDQNENYILRPSTVAIAKKLKAIIQKDKLTIVDIEGVGLGRLKQQYKNDVELEYHVEQLKKAVLTEAKWNNDEDDVLKPKMFERHMSKNTKPHPSFYNNDFYYLVCLSTEETYTTSITKHYAVKYYKLGIEDMIFNRWSKETHRYIFEAFNGIHHWEDSRIDFFKAEMSTRTEGNVYSELRIKSVVRIVVKKKWGYGFLTLIVVRRFKDQEYEFSYADLPRLSLNDVDDMYLLQVQDKLYHLLLEFVKYFNNTLLLLSEES
ncbi:hypothetical protein Tco_1517068 [Tanacetum coccineum]